MTKPAPKPDPSDYGPPELAKHSSMVLEETMKAGVYRARNCDASVLDRYHNRHRLDDNSDVSLSMYDAGNRLAGDWAILGAQPTVIAPYSDMIVSGGVLGFAEARENARKRVDAALDAIGEGKQEVVMCCCYDEAVGRYHMEKLRVGLKQLASHYGY